MAQDGKAGNLEEELSRQVEKLKEENLLLMRDIENMCLQSAPTSFSSSMVVSERIYSAETEMVKAKSELNAAVAERDSLREDIAQMRKAKGTSDSTWRTERARADMLEKELNFYQEQSMAAMAERDDALEEVEQAKKGSLHLEASLREAQSKADRESDLLAKVHKALDAANSKAAGLEAKVAELSKLSEVKKELSCAQAELAKEKQQNAGLEEANRRLEKELSDVSRQLAASEATCASLQSELADAKASAEEAEEVHKRELERLQGLLLSAEATADDANANREEYEDSLYAARAEVELSRKAAKSATAAKEEALRELEAMKARQGEDSAGWEALSERCNELKTRLAAATEEKVMTIMQLADQKAENQSLKDQIQALSAKAGGKHK